MPSASRRCLAFAATSSRRASQRASEESVGSNLPSVVAPYSALKTSLYATAAQVSTRVGKNYPPPSRFKSVVLPQKQPTAAGRRGHEHGQHGDITLWAHDMSTVASSSREAKGKQREYFVDQEEYEEDPWESEEGVGQDAQLSSSLRRRSPAARYGLTSNARLTLPVEMTEGVQNLITGEQAQLACSLSSISSHRPLLQRPTKLR